MAVIAPADITGLILAGGQGRRLGGQDKGLVLLDGVPMVQKTLARLAPQVSHVMISANRNLRAYQAYGVPVLVDLLSDFAGPLAGIQAGLNACTTPYLATVPCDSPFLPMDLIGRLASALDAARADLAIAVTMAADGQRQAHPVFSLMKRDCLSGLNRYLQTGARGLGAWTRTCQLVEVVFDDVDSFLNINTAAELEASKQRQPGKPWNR